MPKSAPPPPLSPLARSLARLDKLSLCGPRLLPGQIDAEMKRNPRFRAHMEGIRQCAERAEQIAFAVRDARAELAAHSASGKATKGDKR